MASSIALSALASGKIIDTIHSLLPCPVSVPAFGEDVDDVGQVLPVDPSAVRSQHFFVDSFADLRFERRFQTQRLNRREKEGVDGVKRIGGWGKRRDGWGKGRGRVRVRRNKK